jgi:hypothetical protein
VGDDLFVTVNGLRELKPAIPEYTSGQMPGSLVCTVSIHTKSEGDTRLTCIVSCGKVTIKSASSKNEMNLIL